MEPVVFKADAVGCHIIAVTNVTAVAADRRLRA
jgi:hypothetical protein